MQRLALAVKEIAGSTDFKQKMKKKVGKSKNIQLIFYKHLIKVKIITLIKFESLAISRLGVFLGRKSKIVKNQKGVSATYGKIKFRVW